jgi:hypothetical protein
MFQGFLEPLRAEDIAILFILCSRPYHVNIADLLVLPTAQASATILKKIDYYFTIVLFISINYLLNLRKWRITILLGNGNLSISQRTTKQSYLAFNSKTTLGQDYKIRDQINGSSGSVMDNIAEGFGREETKNL